MKIENEKINIFDCVEIIQIVINKLFIANGRKIRVNIIRISIIISIMLLVFPILLSLVKLRMSNAIFESYINVASIIIAVLIAINVFLIMLIKVLFYRGKYTKFESDKIVEVLTNNSNINLDYSKIEYVIYGKRVICVSFGKGKNSSSFIYLMSHKDKVINEIKKHKEDLKVFSYY